MSPLPKITVAILALFLSLGLVFAQNPYSDPSNTGEWILNTDVSDEFNAASINEERWYIVGKIVDGEPTYNHPDHDKPVWKGRAPSQFSGDNYRLENGTLKLEARWEPDFPFSDEVPVPTFGEPLPYKNITAACFIGRTPIKYGYIEIKSKAADTEITSGFWSLGDDLEFDFFEMFGDGREANKEHLDSELWWSIRDWENLQGKPSYTEHRDMGFRGADDFHIYGIEWDEDYIKYYLDGNLISTVMPENATAWALANRDVDSTYNGYVATTPVYLWLDMEIFSWQGMPDSKEDLTLNGTPEQKAGGYMDFEIDYVRVWQKDFTTGPKPVSAVEVLSPTLYMYEGQRGFLYAEVQPWDATDNTYSWSTDDNTVVVVNQAGALTAKGIGTCRITATTTDGGYTASTVVTVVEKSSSNLLLNGDFETGDLSFWGLSNGDVKAGMQEVYEGNYTGHVFGSGAIKQKVHVQPNTVYTISGWGKVAEDGQNVMLGSNLALKNSANNFTSINYEQKSVDITTGPEDKYVDVYVWHGRAEYGGFVDQISMSGGPSMVPALGINISATSKEIIIGDELTLIAEVLPVNAENTQVEWSSSDESIARVDENGKVTSSKGGDVLITATSVQGGFTASCILRIKYPMVSYQAEDATINYGSLKSQHLGFTGTGYVTPYRRVGANIEWNNVEATAGEYMIGFTYANRNLALPCDVYVNEVKVKSLPCDITVGWTDYVDVQFMVTLQNGNNIIRIETTTVDGGPNIDKLNVQDKTITLIEKESNINSVILYPNPFQYGDKLALELELPMNATVSISTMQGAIVYVQDYKNQSTLEIDAELPSGFYLVTIMVDNQVLDKKLIVK